MIELQCPCGARYQLLSDEVARRARCPTCGARFADARGSAPIPPEPPPEPPRAIIPPRKPTPSSPPSAPSPPAESDDKTKLTLRKGNEPIKPRPVSLPILDRPSPPVGPSDDVPILLPFEDEPQPLSPKPVSATTPKAAPPSVPRKPSTAPPAASPPTQEPSELAPRLTLPPSAERHALSISNERPAATNAAKCELHGHVITHACMNCSKPLCMECVHQNGYYCSAECKSAYQARQPSRGKGPRLGSGVDKAFELLARAKVPLIILLALWAGYYVYTNYIGCHGKISLHMTVNGELGAAGKVKLIEPDVVLYQANDDLRKQSLSSQQVFWKIDLRPLEEKNMELSFDYDDNGRPTKAQLVESRERDRLRFLDVSGDNVVVCSSRQLLVFSLKDGSLKWKYFDPEKRISVPVIEEQGILCTCSSLYGYFGASSSNAAPPQTVHFAIADGTVNWSLTNAVSLYNWGGAPSIHHGDLVMLSGGTGLSTSYYKTKARTTAKPKASKNSKSSKSSKAAKSKPSLDEFGGDEFGYGGDDEYGEGETEIDESSVPTAGYSLDFLSLADGTMRAQKPLTLTIGGHVVSEGDLMCVVAGADLLVYDKGVDPIWTKKLPGFISVIGASNGVVAAQTSKGLVALDARTGQQKWVREGLPRISQLHVGPDHAIYATMSLRKEEADDGEIADYRKPLISTEGRPYPFNGMVALVKLHPNTGKTVWGVQFIGHEVMFSGKSLYTVDTHQPTHILSAISKNVPDLSLRCLSMRSGKEIWLYIVKGELHHAEVVGDKFFVVMTPEPQIGSGNYEMQYIEHNWW